MAYLTVRPEARAEGVEVVLQTGINASGPGRDAGDDPGREREEEGKKAGAQIWVARGHPGTV
ncbi:MAG TPA: hypothetical protein PLI70_05065 [Gemmatimonadales bacterium]|nr:hypothetical protein [Gemmatimonadales bacterium]